MLNFRFLLSLLIFVTTAGAAHPYLCCDYNGGKVCAVSAEGLIEWEFPVKAPQDCWRLPNGNYLFAYVGGAMEVVPKTKEVVWEYKAPEKTEAHGCQPLPDGNVLVVEGGTSRLVEVDRTGKIAKEIKLTTDPAVKMHNQYRGSRKTADGHYFVCFKGEGKVVELDSAGTVLRAIKVSGDPHEVVPLPNKHLLITCGDGHKVIELDEHDKPVWELNENDLEGNPLRLMAGCQRLPNGNTVLCVYLGHGHIGQQAQVLEVTPQNKVVWSQADHEKYKTINQIQLLDVPGDVTKGEILR